MRDSRDQIPAKRRDSSRNREESAWPLNHLPQEQRRSKLLLAAAAATAAVLTAVWRTIPSLAVGGAAVAATAVGTTAHGGLGGRGGFRRYRKGSGG